MNNYYPDDCGYHSKHNLPWAEPMARECASCGSTMSISNMNEKMLECDNNEECDYTVDLSDSGMNGW